MAPVGVLVTKSVHPRAGRLPDRRKGGMVVRSMMRTATPVVSGTPNRVRQSSSVVCRRLFVPLPSATSIESGR